ncbi:MAG: hypothetical protein H7Y07_12080 [Pyrinomonadaceae bacterium]|nr:hypothetical protein [Sphingobacteriaceae bacterium]
MKTSNETQFKEGKVAKMIEDQTGKIPSEIYLLAAIIAIGASLSLKIMGRKHTALFVGQWASPFLLFGIYNKIVKTQGHDQSQDENRGY